MRHKAKIDWWIAVAVMVATFVPAAQEQYFIAPLPLLILLTCCAPQFYQTNSEGLMIRAGLVRRFIPYREITFIGPSNSGYNFALSLDQVKIQYGLASEVSIAPADPAKFLADIESRASHLRRRGRSLVPVFA